jgi:hypothetical protein
MNKVGSEDQALLQNKWQRYTPMLPRLLRALSPESAIQQEDALTNALLL